MMEGRVEVCDNQTWWAVSCSNWDFRDATVVCRHLHYPANCEWCNKNTEVLPTSGNNTCMKYLFPFPPPTLNNDFRSTDT